MVVARDEDTLDPPSQAPLRARRRAFLMELSSNDVWAGVETSAEAMATRTIVVVASSWIHVQLRGEAS